jgi:cold shock protein
MQGVIKKIVSDRGFGFISADRGDVFFHVTSCVDVRFDDLQVGQTVEYELDREGNEQRAKGPRATAVKTL